MSSSTGTLPCAAYLTEFLGFAFPFLFQTLLERVGFRWTLRFWALAILVTIGFAIMGMQPRLPVPKYQRGQRPRFIPPQMHFLKTSLFWLLVRRPFAPRI